MRQVLIDIEYNRVTTIWGDGSTTWLPLDSYEFKGEEEYLAIILTGDTRTEYREPRMISGDFLIALLKRILHNN